MFNVIFLFLMLYIYILFIIFEIIFTLQENTNLTTAKIVVISSEKKAYEEMAMKGVSSLYDCRKRRFVAISSLISEVIFSS